MADDATDGKKRASPWLTWGGSGGAAALLIGAAVGFVRDEMAELRDVVKSEGERNREAVLRLENRISEQAHENARERRELEIRVERIEEWKARVPDGVGLDRWEGTDQEIYMGRVQRLNPTLTLPDISDLLDR